MNELKAMKTVYSYRFPEVRDLITELTNPFPHDVFLESTSPPGALDDFHDPVIDKVLALYADSVPDLRDFGFRYPTSGSEEGIREILTLLQSQGVENIYVLRGEYEGYKFVGETRCIDTVEVDAQTNPRNLEPGYWFISNPSARDGNIIPNKVIDDVCEAGHQVFYDLAYLGSTRPHEFDLSHENIFAAVISFSKPFGLFYDRIGFTFSREAVPSLYANKWFKNILGLMIAGKIAEELDPAELYDKYRPVQEEIIDGINRDFSLGMRPSDALLLGHITNESAQALDPRQKEMISSFQREDVYRFCLSLYYLEHEKNKEGR